MVSSATFDGGYIVIGTTYYNGGDIWLVKTDSSGNILWKKSYGGDWDEYGYSVEQTIDGEYVIAGMTESSLFNEDLWLLKTNTVGDTLWSRVYGVTSDVDLGYSLQQTDDNGYIIAGLGDGDPWLLKTNSQGDTTWTNKYLLFVGKFYSLDYTKDGGFIITGDYLPRPPGDYDILVIKTDSLGKIPVEISPTEIFSPRGGSSEEIPEARFMNFSTETVSEEFYYRCEIINVDSAIVHYSDSVLATYMLEPWESINIEFPVVEWPLGKPAEYQVIFYASRYSGDSLRSRPMSTTIWWNGIAISEQTPVKYPSGWQITQLVGSQITLRYSDHPQGFHVDIFNASGRKVDELHSTQPSGTLKWGAGYGCYGPGVYFIRDVSDHPVTHKVVLVR